MKFRVFIDTNVFIYAIEFPNSNSAKIIKLLNQGKIETIISERVLKEITRYLEKYQTMGYAKQFRRYLIDSCTIIKQNNVNTTVQKLKTQIKDKDLEQLAVVKQYAIKYLIAYDKDFENQEEYITPKQFLELLNLQVSDTEF